MGFSERLDARTLHTQSVCGIVRGPKILLPSLPVLWTRGILLDYGHIIPQSAADPAKPLRLWSPGILGAFVKTAAEGAWSEGVGCRTVQAWKSCVL